MGLIKGETGYNQLLNQSEFRGQDITSTQNSDGQLSPNRIPLQES